MPGPELIDEALRLVGELLQAQGERFRVVVIGGAAANLLGIVSRTTTDVDILAFASRDRSGRIRLEPPEEPLPRPMREAAATVADDLGLDSDWLNTGPASQWKTGLPPGLDDRIEWRDYGGLVVGLVGRRDLIFFKLYASADQTGPDSVHFQDLLALAPTDEELESAAVWVRSQDPSPDFIATLSQVVAHARHRRAQDH